MLDRLFINSSHSLICCFLSKLHQSPLTFNYKETEWLSCNKALFFFGRYATLLTVMHDYQPHKCVIISSRYDCHHSPQKLQLP